jgi:hypothetical protein
MALAARKQPSPPDLVEQIRRELDVAALRVQQAERARAQYAEASVTNPKAQADYRRADDDVKLAQGEVARLKLALVGAEQQARAAEVDRVAKERAAQIQRVEALLAERDQVAHEAAAAVKILDETFRKLLAIGRDIAAAWPLGAHDGSSCVLTPGSITRALQHEIFRVGSRPHFLGGFDPPDALMHLPGGMSPTLEFINQPNKVTPLVEVLAQASAHLSAIMRTGKAAPNGAHTQVQQRPRTDAEIRLGDLLKEQAALASDPAGEERYQANLTEIAKITAEIEAEKQPGAQST